MDTVTSRDGTSIAVDRTGEGPPLILVDGALQHRAIDLATARLAELLSGLTVYRYDRRGRGDSGDTRPYGVEREIEDIDALIAVAGGRVRAFGMSSGANLALEAAAHGSAISALALYEPPMVVDDSRSPVPADYRARLTELVAAGHRGDAVGLFLTAGVGLTPETVSQMPGAPFWQAFEAVAHTLPYDAAIVEDVMSGGPLPADRWRSVTVPTLVIDGGASPRWARNAVAALVDVLPNAERATLEGQTHQYDPEVLAPVLAGFFADAQLV